ncbi:MAG: Ig-like domain-containing protein, partial [Lachnospiraceae bacterium]|nr:Ig-like domain-containing protein [Lachnospiraceae bacterium]
QDTLYLQKFDLEKRSGYLHQYMQNVQAAYSEGRSMKTMYNNANCLNSAFVFKIPVFTNMPGVEYTISPKTLKFEKGKTKSLTIKGNGMTIGNSAFTFSSSAPSVATVDKNGVITAVDKGDAVITAVGGSDTNNVKLTCAVSVYIPLQSISLNATEETLYRGDTADVTHPQTLTLQVSYMPADTTDDKTVTWTTSNKNVAIVKKNENDSATAIVTAVGEGTAKITAKVGTNHTAVCTVTVKVPMQSAALNKTELTLFEGKQEKLTVSYLPMDTTDDTDVVWTSENPEVASVINGTVTAKMPGTTVVHAKIGPFDGSQQELSCTVTVEQCSVTFTNETGTAVLLQEFLSYGKTLGTLQSDFPWNMESEGNRIFSGWYTKPDGGGTKVTKDTVVYSDMTLYPYYQENDRGFFVKPIGDMTYTGSAIKPEIEVYDKETLLIPGKDYTVSYKNNTKVNDASVEKTAPQVVVKGKGSYSGTQTVIFKIIQKDISEEDITADDLLTKYNGKTQKLAPVVKRNGKTLKKGTDYTVTYLASGTGSYLRAGSYAVLITGINGYTGERIIHIKITPKNLISKASVSAIKNQPYNGTPITPVLTIRYSGKKLTEDVDYTVEYLNNTEIGTAQAVITGIGNYIGTKKVTFKITGTAISKAKITGIVSKEYTGEAITQDYTITDTKGVPLTEGTHYTLQYKNNVNAGTATMLFTGIGSYSGTVKKTFKIMPYNIKNNTQTYEEQPAFLIDDKELSVPYKKGGAKPPVSVSYKDNALTEKTDYTLSYKNNTAVNDGSNEKKLATITIKGKGNFTGTVTKTFTITPKDISTVSISAADAVYRERKNAWKITPVLTDTNGKKLVAGTDYDRSFSYTYAHDVMLSDGTYRHAGEEVQKDDIPMPGELNDAKITVTVQGIKNYKKEISATYRIVPQSITNASVKIPTQYYIGRAADGNGIPVTLSKDDITIVVSGQKLSSSDFEIISYSNNTAKGKAKVTIKGVNGYGGIKTVTYTIAAKPIIWWQNITQSVTASFENSNTTRINLPYRELGALLPKVVLKGNDEILSEVSLAYETVWRYKITPPKKGKATDITVIQEDNGKLRAQASENAVTGFYEITMYPIVTNGTEEKELAGIRNRVYVDTDAPTLGLGKTEVTINIECSDAYDAVRMHVAGYELQEEKMEISCIQAPEQYVNENDAKECFSLSMEEEMLTIGFQKEKMPSEGTYVFEITPCILVEGSDKYLEKRQIAVICTEFSN